MGSSRRFRCRLIEVARVLPLLAETPAVNKNKMMIHSLSFEKLAMEEVEEFRKVQINKKAVGISLQDRNWPPQYLPLTCDLGFCGIFN